MPVCTSLAKIVCRRPPESTMRCKILMCNGRSLATCSRIKHAMGVRMLQNFKHEAAYGSRRSYSVVWKQQDGSYRFLCKSIPQVSHRNTVLHHQMSRNFSMRYKATQI